MHIFCLYSCFVAKEQVNINYRLSGWLRTGLWLAKSTKGVMHWTMNMIWLRGQRPPDNCCCIFITKVNGCAGVGRERGDMLYTGGINKHQTALWGNSRQWFQSGQLQLFIQLRIFVQHFPIYCDDNVSKFSTFTQLVSQGIFELSTSRCGTVHWGHQQAPGLGCLALWPLHHGENRVSCWFHNFVFVQIFVHV